MKSGCRLKRDQIKIISIGCCNSIISLKNLINRNNAKMQDHWTLTDIFPQLLIIKKAENIKTQSLIFKLRIFKPLYKILIFIIVENFDI